MHLSDEEVELNGEFFCKGVLKDSSNGKIILIRVHNQA